MQRAGLAIARLTLALAPHARCIWIACGPGNNGGDGFEAALHLRQHGKNVHCSWTGPPHGKPDLPPDAEASRQRALAAGVHLSDQPPQTYDVCIDALLGLGGRPPDTAPGQLAEWLTSMQASQALRLNVDLPSGLNADTGVPSAHPPSSTRHAETHTLSLLTLKPGLFTASGRDQAGQVWFDDLGVNANAFHGPFAELLGRDTAAVSRRENATHTSHKGSFGDVAVVGGESTAQGHMAGAALLAARAALHAGAGRVMVALLGEPGLTLDTSQPELMFRPVEALDPDKQVIVCGCGGGQAVKRVLPELLATAKHLVLDADALNAIAEQAPLQAQLASRHSRGLLTVLTPHPLEAARLLGNQASAVQGDRLKAAQELADRFACVVVLKGSGTVVAEPGTVPRINGSGNARLATAGTGDVLAGMTGAWLASGWSPFEAACGAVFAHGALADAWPHREGHAVMTASRLARQDH